VLAEALKLFQAAFPDLLGCFGLSRGLDAKAFGGLNVPGELEF
jgi:hypothetical protein